MSNVEDGEREGAASEAVSFSRGTIGVYSRRLAVLFAKIGLVAIEHGVKHFVILRNIEIVIRQRARERISCASGEKLIKLRGSAAFKLRTAEMSGRNIENAIGSVRCASSTLTLFDETSQRGFRSTIDSIEGELKNQRCSP